MGHKVFIRLDLEIDLKMERERVHQRYPYPVALAYLFVQDLCNSRLGGVSGNLLSQDVLLQEKPLPDVTPYLPYLELEEPFFKPSKKDSKVLEALKEVFSMFSLGHFPSSPLRWHYFLICWNKSWEFFKNSKKASFKNLLTNAVGLMALAELRAKIYWLGVKGHDCPLSIRKENGVLNLDMCLKDKCQPEECPYKFKECLSEDEAINLIREAYHISTNWEVSEEDEFARWIEQLCLMGKDIKNLIPHNKDPEIGKIEEISDFFSKLYGKLELGEELSSTVKIKKEEITPEVSRKITQEIRDKGSSIRKERQLQNPIWGIRSSLDDKALRRSRKKSEAPPTAEESSKKP